MPNETYDKFMTLTTGSPWEHVGCEVQRDGVTQFTTVEEPIARQMVLIIRYYESMVAAQPRADVLEFKGRE